MRGQLSADDVRTFLTVREDPEPLYFWAGDLVYCGYTAAAVTLLRESVRRNYCAVSAIEIDPTFAAIRDRAEYRELLGAARACRSRFREHVTSLAEHHPGSLTPAGCRPSLHQALVPTRRAQEPLVR